MIKVHTEIGKTYCVSTTKGCEVFAFVNGNDVKILSISGEGQGYFTAPERFAECNDDKAAFTECKGGFSVAAAGSSAGGGGTPSPVIPGQKIVPGNPPDKILRHGEIYHFPFTDNPTNCMFTDCTFDDAAGRVITFEVWVDTGYCAPPIDFNVGWQWVGVIPKMQDNYTSYRVTVRKVPGMTPEINYAYCVPLPQPA